MASRQLVPYTPPGPIPLSARLQTAVGSFWFRGMFVAAAVSAGWAAGFSANRPNGDQLATAQVQTGDIAGLKADLANLQADIAGMKGSVQIAGASVEQVQRNVASSLIRLSSAVDRLEDDRVADRTKLTERLDRLEKQTSAMTPTASIAPTSGNAASVAVVPTVPKTQLPVPKSPIETSSIPGRESSAVPMTQPMAQKPEVPIRGYVLRGVSDGVALVETRFGLREITPGQTLPGAGRVQSIERRGRKWVVITTAGLIDEQPYR